MGDEGFGLHRKGHINDSGSVVSPFVTEIWRRGVPRGEVKAINMAPAGSRFFFVAV